MKGKVYITNAFSLSMLPELDYDVFIIEVRKLKLEQVKALIKENFISAIGHEATAKVLSQLLQIEIPFNRIQIKMNPDDYVIVFQLNTRLPEGKILSEEELKNLEYNFFLVHF